VKVYIGLFVRGLGAHPERSAFSQAEADVGFAAARQALRLGATHSERFGFSQQIG
jgi:hypothetical protein